MIDPVLKKAMEKRDEALREVERWEAWVKAYMELSEPAEDSLDIPMSQRVSPSLDGVDLASSLRGPAGPNGKGNGHGI
jgi:hypothetical protein